MSHVIQLFVRDAVLSEIGHVLGGGFVPIYKISPGSGYPGDRNISYDPHNTGGTAWNRSIHFFLCLIGSLLSGNREKEIDA